LIYREIVHTCSHPAVARAAVDSIGGDFARKFASEASRRRTTRGALAADLVRSFAAGADELDWQQVSAAARDSDLPILSGLRQLLEIAIERETPPAWMIAARAPAA
jgi:hypothetical protein